MVAALVRLVLQYRLIQPGQPQLRDKRCAGYGQYRGADLQGPDGLNVGMSAAAAKEVEGKAFSTSAAQGGSWLLNTSSGKLFGYLDGVTSKARIASIDAGSVGCAAMTP